MNTRNTFEFKKMDGYYVTLRQGVFVGYTILVNKDKVSPRIKKFQGKTLDDVWKMYYEWLGSVNA